MKSDTHYLKALYPVRSYETLADGCLSVFDLLNYLQDAAWHHANRLGVGVETLHTHGLTWMMHRLNVETMRWPLLGQSVQVRTWPSGVDKYFVRRDFEVTLADENAAPIARASSIWIVADVAKRQMISVPAFISAIGVVNEEAMEKPTAKFQVAGPWEKQQMIQAGFFQLDMNRHVNNSWFVRWALCALPEDFLAAHTLAHAEYIFKQEGNWKDELAVSWKRDGEHFLHLVESAQSGRELFRARTRWSARSLPLHL